MAHKTIEDILKETKIYQILRPKLTWSSPNISLREALNIMQHERSGYLLICDEHMRALGVFTERDVLMKVLKKGVKLDEPVKNFMKADGPVLSKEDTVGEAINAMFEHSVRHIPLADEHGQMNGILSIRTVVNFLAELFPTEVFNLPPRADQIHETAEGG